MTHHLQNNFLLSDAAKAMRSLELRRIKPDEAYERLKDLRFGWTAGKPICPKCEGERIYEYNTRSLFKCAKCGCQFSVTSGTALSSRKATHKAILQTVALRLEGASLATIAQETGLNYRGVWQRGQSLKIYVGNIRPTEKELRLWDADNAPPAPGEDLVARVHRLTASLPVHLREDVGQEMILGVLEGTISESQLAASVKDYAKKFYGSYDNRFSHVSLDAPVPGTEGMRWDETLSHERSIWSAS